MSKFQRLVNNWQLVPIILVGFFLRFYKLDFQSLWLDELHTMNEAAPGVSWREMFQSLKCCDPHPPLQFILAKISFSIFGHTAMVARMISVIAGTISIWAMYDLGKQFMNKRLGLIAAVITSVNFYNIFYSQEARCYIFAFLFAALSFSYWIRLVRVPSRKNALLYGLFSLLLLYSHYYSFFVLGSQAFLTIMIFFQEKNGDAKKMFTAFAISAAIMIIGYLPWIPTMLAQLQIKSFWITETPSSFLQDYFFLYFGNSELLKPLLLLLVFVYVARISNHVTQAGTIKIKNDLLGFGFVVILAWIFITLLIPYLRSLLVVPMLFPRYSIVVLPAIILILAFALFMFQLKRLRYPLLVLFAALSLIDLFATKKYYATISKTQFREVTSFIVMQNPNNYPIVNAKTAWHQRYYLDRFGSKAEQVYISPDAFIDSVLQPSSPRWGTNGFWLAGMHNDPPPTKEKLAQLDSSYILVKDNQFYDAWAQLYVLKSVKPGYVQLGYNDFTDGAPLPEEKLLAIWNGAVHTRVLHLKKGNYKVTITSKGTESGDVYPHLIVYAGQRRIGDFFTTAELGEKELAFELTADEDIVFKLEMDNDALVPGESDRNAFVKALVIEAL